MGEKFNVKFAGSLVNSTANSNNSFYRNEVEKKKSKRKAIFPSISTKAIVEKLKNIGKKVASVNEKREKSKDSEGILSKINFQIHKKKICKEQADGLREILNELEDSKNEDSINYSEDTFNALYGFGFSDEFRNTVSKFNKTETAKLLSSMCGGEKYKDQGEIYSEYEKVLGSFKALDKLGAGFQSAKAKTEEQIKEILINKLQELAIEEYERLSGWEVGMGVHPPNIPRELKSIMQEEISLREIGIERTLSKSEEDNVRAYRVQKYIVEKCEIGNSVFKGSTIGKIGAVEDAGVRLQNANDVFNNKFGAGMQKDWEKLKESMFNQLSKFEVKHASNKGSYTLNPNLYMLRYVLNDGKLQPTDPILKNICKELEEFKKKYPFEIDKGPVGSGAYELVRATLELNFGRAQNERYFDAIEPNVGNFPKGILKPEEMKLLSKEGGRKFLDNNGSGEMVMNLKLY